MEMEEQVQWGTQTPLKKYDKIKEINSTVAISEKKQQILDDIEVTDFDKLLLASPEPTEPNNLDYILSRINL
jgi:hypothetical protein